MTLRISVRDDFSRFPAGRFITDGPHSGQKFREDVLVPRIADAKTRHEKLHIQLDGTLGYGSSFLEEAFGGLIRNRRLTVREFFEIVVLETVDDALKTEINSYVMESKRG